MQNDHLPFEALTSGYVLIPKKLLTYNFNNRDTSMSYMEAFLTVLAIINFADIEVAINGDKLMCKRGQSLLSFPSRAKLFNWTVGKTHCFFRKMVAQLYTKLQPTRKVATLLKGWAFSVLPSTVTGKRAMCISRTTRV